jgi:hypothetical protein
MTLALKKAGATHIVWVAVPDLSNPDIQNIESDLIETFNPRANMSRPVPPVALQGRTKEIIAEFRSFIHAHRNERSEISNIDAENWATTDPVIPESVP